MWSLKLQTNDLPEIHAGSPRRLGTATLQDFDRLQSHQGCFGPTKREGLALDHQGCSFGVDERQRKQQKKGF